MSGHLPEARAAKLRAIIADTRGETGRYAERSDIEDMLRLLGFDHTEDGSVRTYQHPKGVTFYVHLDSTDLPVGIARDLLDRLKERGLIPEGT